MALGTDELAKLIIKIQTDVNDLKKGLNEGKNKVSDFGNTVKKIFAGIGFAVVTKRITGLVKESIDLMDTMAKTAQKVGVATEDLSNLSYAAKISGVQFGSLTTGLRLFAKNMYDASNGIGEAKDAFADLGVNVTDSEGNLKTVNELLFEVADKMKGLESETQRTAIAQRIFGRSGADMIPLLNQGAEGIKKLTEENRKLGGEINSRTARAAEELNDNLNALKTAVNGLFLSLAQDLLPGLVETTQAMKEFVIEYRAVINLPFKVIGEIAKNFKQIAIALTAILAIKFAPVVFGWITALGSFKIALDASVASLGIFKSFLIALIGLKIGEWLGELIDKFIYLTTGLDISGMNRIKEMLGEQGEEAEFLQQKLEEANKKLSELGFIGPDAMEKFNAAVKAGTVVFNKATGQWEKHTKSIKTGTQEATNIIEKLKAKTRELQLQFIALTDPVRAAEMALEDFIKQTTSGHPERFAASVNQLREAYKRLYDEQQKRALAGVESEERLSEAMIKIKDAMQQVEQSYETGLVSVSEYYNKKRQLTEQSYQAEIQSLRDQIEASNDLIEQRKLMIQVNEKEAESKREISKLNWEEEQSTRDLIDSIEHLREAKATGFFGRSTESITARYDEELLELEERYAEVIEKVKALDNEKLAAIEEGLTKEQLLKDLMAAKDIQRAELVAKREMEIRQQHYRTISDLYGGMSDIMGAMYEASGKETRAFFEMQKQFAIAEAFINAHQAATKAMAQGGIWGMVQAAAIYAKAVAHAMAIAQQKPAGYATGGLVTQGSGAIDDTTIRVTKKEFVQPVAAVKYYGESVMEAMRRMLIPKSLFSGFGMMTPSIVTGAAAGGGLIGDTITRNLAINVPVTVDDSRLANDLKRGIEKTIINIMRGYSR